MNNSFTPGPWVATKRYGNTTTEVYAEPDATSVALVKTHFERVREKGIHVEYLPTPHGEANARLIAAAPDLLAACEYMANQTVECEQCNGGGNTPGTVDACHYCGGYGERLGNDCMDALAAIRAAIAKARGEA